ncbi:MAG: hypothetical protein ACOCWJ_03895, partial [Verrucomicrobiota bacterium]
MKTAAQWPVFECLISECWRDTANLTEILISKEPPFGGVACCVFLVDLGCLGPKQGFVTQFRTKAEYEHELRSLMMSRNPMFQADYCLAAKILRESIAYSSRLGFKLPPEVLQALSALGSLEEAASECQEDIALGAPDGKPVYMAGPDDDVDRIMSILTASCGHGNFHFTVPQSPIPPDFFD